MKAQAMNRLLQGDVGSGKTIVALLAAINRDLDISCGCFSTGEGHGVGYDLIRRDAVMFLGCVLILFQRR